MAWEVRDVVITQKRELDGRLAEAYVERGAELSALKSNLVKVVMGPRRCGKSFFAMHAMKAEGSFGYVNFDDERLAKTADFDALLEAVNSVYGSPRLLLLDEIQNVPSWELVVNRLQRQGFNLVITGSNSNLLSMELASHLTGRHVRVLLLPFSFKERVALETKELTGAEKKELFLQFLESGGYPEPYVKDLERMDYLRALFDAVIYKDIVKRFKIRNPVLVENVATYLVSNVAKEFSFASLAKAVGLGSTLTAQKYAGYLEEAFLFHTVRRYSAKARETLSSNKKIYCIDNGFVCAKALKPSPDYGRLLENAVAVELKRRSAGGGFQVFYWLNAQHEEVDFVVKKGSKVEALVQVCYDVSDARTKEREVRSLLKAGKELGCRELLVLTAGHESTEQVEWFGLKGKIRFVSAWKWLLE